MFKIFEDRKNGKHAVTPEEIEQANMDDLYPAPRPTPVPKRPPVPQQQAINSPDDGHGDTPLLLMPALNKQMVAILAVALTGGWIAGYAMAWNGYHNRPSGLEELILTTNKDKSEAVKEAVRIISSVDKRTGLSTEEKTLISPGVIQALKMLGDFTQSAEKIIPLSNGVAPLDESGKQQPEQDKEELNSNVQNGYVPLDRPISPKSGGLN